ncbi:MAG: formate/nitrite transporter family protein [Fusobacteriaceae bacterium]|nr:formate/nitrite transporter family protein [Fusobacteriaceae bacterium]MBP6468192.1 formate/nitrite transporter family protein [Fusobacteriaceae bacterium]MBP9595975.1 formate/nitrite transporter family protein [Fusobacteriaceae bacterium]MBU9917707.1 formate/nitrite transporter family protein [Fusobacteriaceae bacterium]
MEKLYLAPVEIVDEIIKMGVKKAKNKPVNIFLLGILAGMFIGLAYVGNLTATQVLGTVDKGLGKFVGACIFPVGIMLVLFVGGSLFTGNNLVTIAFLDKQIPFKKVILNWIVVWSGNLVGAVGTAFLLLNTEIYHSHELVAATINLAKHKAELTATEGIISGFFCNILVALGVWMTYAGKDLTSKLLASWFPVMLFALCGFQHSVANMYILSMAKMLDPSVFGYHEMLKNLLNVSIGNILSGGIFIPVIYYYLYKVNHKH